MRGKRCGNIPDYLKSPARVASYYASQAKSGRKPNEPRLTRDQQVAGGKKRGRLGIPDGETKKSMELKMSLVEQKIVERMNELEDRLPDGLVLSPMLSVEKQEELGITINPLYYLQKMFLSGIMTPKEQIAILTKLTDFTHQKTTQKSEVSLSRPEAFLEQLAHEEVIDGEVVSDQEEAGD